MRFLKLYILLTVFLVSCKSAKTTSEANNAKNSLVNKVIENHIATNFNRKTVDAKLRIGFENSKQNIDFSVRMKIKKDEVIWMKGTKFITVFKAKITPEKVSFYSPYKKNYIEGDFETLKEILGFEVNFYQLQNLLLGQTLFDVKAEKHDISKVNEDYLLTPKKQPDLFDIFYVINQVHFKLNEQTLVNTSKQQRLDIKYPNYKVIDNTLFPENIQITAKSKSKTSNIDISVRSIIFDEEISIPYEIPEGYKEIKL